MLLKMRFAAALIVIIMLFAPLFTLTASADAPIGCRGVLVDLDECLTEAEEKQLLDMMNETANKISCNVGIVITRDLNGMTDSQYAKYFGNTNFGSGSSYAVFMFLNTHDNPAYDGYEDKLELNGRGHDYYNNKANAIFNKVYDGLDSAGFYSAGREFCRALELYAGSKGGGFEGFVESFSIFFAGSFFGLIAAVIVTVIVVNGVVRGYKKRAPISASNYIDQSRTRITRQVDQFVREYTTSVSTSSSSGGHGGGGHSSHGGSHRSGGHSSHGGRHR
ncbi:MAG: TPM domain-containing protein [Ruminococcus sp.]|nr:TPM domain-containing protein [Ruminococcus sp.]